MINSFSGNYAFLSNFYNSPFTYNGKKYRTNEHFFQAAKAKSDILHEYVRNAASAADAKKRGKEIARREDWEGIKDAVMYLGLMLKFQDSRLKQLLLDTGDEDLVEGNTWNDTYWGICNGQGKNKLGKLLMEVRSKI